jgi:DNA-binding NtrC family response regulator
MANVILVIDDEPLILRTIDKALSKVGYSVFKAQNMAELEESLKNAPFDLLITDVYLEDDSVENIIEKVKRVSPSVKILKMSGSFPRNDSYNFIEKPFRIDQLRKKVKDILDQPS